MFRRGEKDLPAPICKLWDPMRSSQGCRPEDCSRKRPIYPRKDERDRGHQEQENWFLELTRRQLLRSAQQTTLTHVGWIAR